MGANCSVVRRKITAEERLKQFPNNTLVVNGTDIICQACTKSLEWAKKSSAKQHRTGVEHMKAVVDYRRKAQAKQVTVQNSLKF